MELGFSYGTASGNTSVSASYSRSLTQAVQATYGVDYGISNKTWCSTEDKKGAGLYQWIVSTGDMKNQAFTWHTVCRTGSNWNKSPECPPPACLDAECLSCATDW